MVGDGTAFGSLLFGYFVYWTIHDDFTAGMAGPGMAWPLVALALFLLAWALMLFARRLNGRGDVVWTRIALLAALVLGLGGSLAGLYGPWSHAMDPTAHVYPAIVWVLVLWTVLHAAVGMIMQLYCLARSVAGRLTARYDMDLHNVVLYWHFMAVTALSTFAVIGLFPEML
jgi:cytochrome c oxidase subunit I+III